MLIARGKKTENIAEYLLYMWQIEDLIRAFEFDIEKIQAYIIDGFDQPAEVKKEIREWYESLIEMMRLENITASGHLQINKNVITELDELHNLLLSLPKENFYLMTYHKVLPLIVELRAKPGGKAFDEVETCLNLLYGMLLLRLQQKEISDETAHAAVLISEFLRMLSAKYKQEKEEGLDLE